MESLIKDVRYGIRSLLKHRSLTALAIVTLALGIGANTAMFSVINAVLLRPLAYREPDRLVWMNESGSEVANRWLSYPNFVDWRARNTSFEAMSTLRGWSTTMTGGDQPLDLNARMVAADYFKVMGVAPLMGRSFSADDDRPGANPVTILSHGFWQSQFAGDKDIVGKTITLDDRAYSVIGVMPESFAHHGPPPLWLPMGPQNWNQRDVRVAGNVIGRLKPGVTIERARAEMNGIAQQLAREHPVANAGADRVNVIWLQESITGNVATSLLILFGAVGLVLLIACANVANLLLARAATRRKEFAVRAALGATRARIIRQLLVESLMLSLAGGLFGLLLASWATTLLGRVAHETIPRLEGLQLSYRVLGFNLLVSLLSGIVFGLAPAWRFSKAELQEILKDSGATTSESEGKRLRGALVIAEVALSVALLVGAGLLIKSVLRLTNADAGFEPRQVVTMDIKVPRNRYRGQGERARLLQQILDRVQAQAGVEAATLSASLPGFEAWTSDIAPEGQAPLQPGELINVEWAIVSADYFKTMRIPILKGRTFRRDEDAEGKPVLLIDENLAQRFWPNEEAVGKHIKYDSPVWHEIIGVVKEVKLYGSEARPLIKIYTPMGRAAVQNPMLSVRTTSNNPQNLVAAITREIHSLDKDVPVTEVTTLTELLAREVSPKRFNAGLLSLFAGLALVLAAIGVYGVTSYTVAQRTHEVGIRMAIGAQKSDVLKLFMREGLKLVLAGLVIGLAGAFALTRLLQSLLFGVSATDGPTFALVAMELLVVALLACYIPARRATKVDPLVALRYE
ncbi:MAG: ABC transporter permease [Pyrinomonadaceae bacterium]|nr:ABC transporter permease [Pyrinomonadaceae bacterium]